MKKDLLLRELAQSGYNIGYAAKKHLATFDIVEKAPGWVSITTLGVGIFALVVPALENRTLAAAITIVGIASFYFNSYQDQRAEYGRVGSRLTSLFTELRAIYYEAQSRLESDSNDDLQGRYRSLLAESQSIGISKQIFLSDWYAHYKFFWQAQTDWLDEQLHFRFWRDRVPLTATLTLVVVVLALGWHFATCRQLFSLGGE